MISILLLSSYILSFYDKLSDKMKEIVNYLIIGFLTTVVSIVSYFLLRIVISNYLVCTILSWIIAVLFAYITNRVFVFHSNNQNIIGEFISFVGARILSLLIEIAFMFISVDVLSFNDRISKIVVQFIIVVVNYIFSKLLVFKRKD